MPKNLVINGYEAHILQVSIASMLDSMEDLPESDPHKKRLLGVHEKIRVLYPEA